MIQEGPRGEGDPAPWVEGIGTQTPEGLRYHVRANGEIFGQILDRTPYDPENWTPAEVRHYVARTACWEGPRRGSFRAALADMEAELQSVLAILKTRSIPLAPPKKITRKPKRRIPMKE